MHLLLTRVGRRNHSLWLHDLPEDYEEAVINACRQAKEDFANGKSKYIICGLVSKKNREFGELIKEKYQIVPNFKGCVVSDTDIGFASIYNEMTRLLFLTKKDIDLNKAYNQFFHTEKK